MAQVVPKIKIDRVDVERFPELRIPSKPRRIHQSTRVNRSPANRSIGSMQIETGENRDRDRQRDTSIFYFYFFFFWRGTDAHRSTSGKSKHDGIETAAIGKRINVGRHENSIVDG